MHGFVKHCTGTVCHFTPESRRPGKRGQHKPLHRWDEETQKKSMITFPETVHNCWPRMPKKPEQIGKKTQKNSPRTVHQFRRRREKIEKSGQ